MAEKRELPVAFHKVLLPEMCADDIIVVPEKFVKEYGEMIPEVVKLHVRNGQEFSKIYNPETHEITGMKQIFDAFDFTKSIMFVFLYHGGDKFDVSVFFPLSGLELSADENDVDMTFVRFCLHDKKHMRSMSVPRKFFDRFHNELLREVDLQMPNGKVFKVAFRHETRLLSGLEEFVAYNELDFGHLVQFTYQRESRFGITVYGLSAVRKKMIIADHPLVFPCTDNFGGFKIRITATHLRQYNYGVYVTTMYKDVTNKWQNGTIIKVFTNDNTWELRIRKRGELTTIMENWSALARKMRLRVGDLCVFFPRQDLLEFDLYRLRKGVA